MLVVLGVLWLWLSPVLQAEHLVDVRGISGGSDMRFRVPIMALRNASVHKGTVYTVHPKTMKVRALSVVVEKIEGQYLVVRAKEKVAGFSVVVAGFEGLRDGMSVVPATPRK